MLLLASTKPHGVIRTSAAAAMASDVHMDVSRRAVRPRAGALRSAAWREAKDSRALRRALLRILGVLDQRGAP
jgi:hypothetical protein